MVGIEIVSHSAVLRADAPVVEGAVSAAVMAAAGAGVPAAEEARGARKL